MLFDERDLRVFDNPDSRQCNERNINRWRRNFTMLL